MAGLTFLGSNKPLSRMIFAGGSDSLMTLVEPPLIIRIAFLLFFGIACWFFLKKLNYKSGFILLVIFFFWVESGRMIAIFPDGHVNTGWFYMKFNRIDLCEGNELDCENILYEEKKIERQLFWNIRIDIDNSSYVFHYGPFISIEKLARLFVSPAE